MGEKKESKLKTIFSKFKKFKGIEIAIVVILVAVMLLIAFGSFSKKEDKQELEAQSTSLEVYGQNLENKIENFVSQISGVSKVECIITFSSGFEQVLAYSNEESKTSGENGTTSSSNSTKTQSVIYTNENGKEVPVVLYEQCPKVAGVVVVCSGASNVNVKLDIIRAISTLLNCNVSCIEVLSSK